MLQGGGQSGACLSPEGHLVSFPCVVWSGDMNIVSRRLTPWSLLPLSVLGPYLFLVWYGPRKSAQSRFLNTHHLVKSSLIGFHVK